MRATTSAVSRRRMQYTRAGTPQERGSSKMKRTITGIPRRSGSALVTVMLVILVVASLLSTMISGSLQQMHMSSRLADQSRALMLAESGAHHAYSVLVTNFAARTNADAFPLTTYDNGTYDADVVAVDTCLAVVHCTGTYNGVVVSVILDVKDFGGGSEGEGGTGAPAYECAILAGGTMKWAGSGTMNAGTGMMHCNGQLKKTGSSDLIAAIVSSSVEVWKRGSGDIEGDASAPSINESGSGHITGTQTVGTVDPITIPDIDLTPYYNEALANGQVYSSDQHIMGSDDTIIPGGIMWVDGDFQKSGSGNLTGCVIATGEVKISGSGDQIKVGDYPAFISRDDDIKYSGSGNVHGLLYAKTGNFDKSGSGDLTGSIICAGNFTKTGSWNLMAYEDSEPVAPGERDEGEPSQLIGISAWQK